MKILDFLSASYSIRRLAPFYGWFLALQLASVCGKTLLAADDMEWSPFVWAKMVLFSFAETTAAFLYISVFLLFYSVLLPKRLHKSRLDGRLRAIGAFLFFYIVFFSKIAELFFWKEFGCSFNFIAVDYLVYTNELLGNLWQTYPMMQLLIVVAVLAGAATFSLCRRTGYRALAVPSLWARLAYLAGAVFFCMLSYAFLDARYAEMVSGNRYNQEAAKNEQYSFFSAFLNSKLNYEDFYILHDEAENARILRQKYAADSVKFTGGGDSLRRHIAASGEEKQLNVMLVVMESMGSEFMNENRALGDDLTPHLTKLAQEGLYFPNVYATGTRTVRGLEAVTLSMPPQTGMSVIRQKDNGNLYNVGTVFKARGYDVKWIYGGYGYFDDMNDFYGANGFEVIDRTSIADDKIHHATIWGVADEDMFTKALEEADRSHAAGKKFFQLLMTTSNHSPYSYPEGRIDIPSKTGRLGAVKYADYAVGDFVARAKEKPWFKDTIFVFIADHGAASAGKKELNPVMHRIPLIFYAPGVIFPERLEKTISQIDAMPTLLGLLNFSYDSPFYGVNALDASYEERYFISNYQYVGYAKGDTLVVLAPVRRSVFYPGNKSAEGAENEQLLDEAVAFYQHAAKWREHMRLE